MTSTSSQVKPNSSRRRLRISPRQRERLTTWIVDKIPHAFDQVLQWLSSRQLLLLILSLVLLLIPLITPRPAIWQQGFIAAILIAVGRFILQLEEHNPSKKVGEYLHLFLVFRECMITKIFSCEPGVSCRNGEKFLFK